MSDTTGNAHTQVAWITCDHCGGRGRVMTTDVRPLALVAWQNHKNDKQYPLIRAIKELRETAGLSLKEAKDAIEEVMADGT